MTERVSSELAKPDDSIAGENKENQTTKVYVTKVPIDVTEERLGEFFKNHAYHTVRASNRKERLPLGIAYIDFDTNAEALAAIQELNGEFLDGKKLELKLYVKYQPKKEIGRRRSILNFRQNQNSGAAEKKGNQRSQGVRRGSSRNSSGDSKKGIDERNARRGSGSKKVHASKTELPDATGSNAVILGNGPGKSYQRNHLKSLLVSEDQLSQTTIFIHRLNIKTTDTDLRAFFAEFDPSDIYIFKSKNTRSRLKFRQPRVYALVTVLAKNGQQDAIKKLTNERLNGKYLKLSPAYLNKIEQVKSAAMGKSQIASPQPQDDQELISEEPAVLDASADVPESPVEIATEIILEAPLEA